MRLVLTELHRLLGGGLRCAGDDVDALPGDCDLVLDTVLGKIVIENGNSRT